MKITYAIALSLFLMTGFSTIRGQEVLTLNSTFSTVENCGYKTKGIFVAWWDKNFDYAGQADELLNTLLKVQQDCLDTYHMRNPPNPIAGYYYNVYIHNGRDLFPDGWAMGQGTDTNGYPFLTIPVGYANANNAGLQHEGFHIFQYSANSPGYAYSGDSQWYVEATANWYAALQHPDSKEEYVTASCITYNPQLPMWYTFNNKEPQDQGNWQRYCHQYGMNIFVNYLTDVREIPASLIVDGFFAQTSQLPQEYLYKGIGPDKFCEIYADFAAHNVGGFEHFPPGIEARTYQELKFYGDLKDVHPLVDTLYDEGTQGAWIYPKNDFVTRAWSYNVYKIVNTQRSEYTFHLLGDPSGTEGAPAAFRGRIVVKTGAGVRYYDMDMKDLTEGTYTYQAAPDDKQINLVIISTPACFRGNQKFFYGVKIDHALKTSTFSLPIESSLGNNYPNPFDEQTIIPYQLAESGSVSLTVTDLSGRIIREITEGIKPAGSYQMTLSADYLSPGIYYYTLKSGDFLETKPLVVEKN